MSHGYHAKVDQNAVNYSDSQATTSTYYASSIAQSGQEDRQSVYTYDSRMDAQKFIQQIGDRAYNTLSDVYFLPTDEDEWTRLNKQHLAFMIALGGLYPAPEVVRSILVPQEGETKKILDLGCGTGVWAAEMAKEFPHCEVLGVDLAPVPIEPMGDIPPGLRYEIDDINLGLSHFKDQFDVVHARLIGSGIRDFARTMEEVHRCVKPGGIVLWMDADYNMYAQDKNVYLPFASDETPDGSWFQRLIYEMRRGATASGKSDIYRMNTILDAGLWEDPLLDPSTCKTASLYLPIGPWLDGQDSAQTQILRYVGSLIRQDLMSAHRAIHPAIKRLGYSDETLLEWSKKADQEMMSMTNPMWMRMQFAWGRRATGNSSSPLPAHSIPTQPLPHYPHFHVYNTRDESLRAAELRGRNKDLPAPPLPTVSK